jgi:DNA-binding Lrp family transcriptional regulator
MKTAFVLVNTDMGSEEEVSESLKKFEEIKEVHGVFGVYDLVVRVEAESMEELKDVISSKIRRQQNVRSTLTMIVID